MIVDDRTELLSCLLVVKSCRALVDTYGVGLEPAKIHKHLLRQKVCLSKLVLDVPFYFIKLFDA